MKVVIIEDEQLAYQKMVRLMKEILPVSQVVAYHDTVESAKRWFQENPAPDLVLMDVQLSDGTAFDLLKTTTIDCPVVFTTAYDKYALDAFKTTSFDYLLKPIKKADLEKALQKIQKVKDFFHPAEPVKKDARIPNDYKKRFVIRFGENIKSLSVDDIAYCYSENKATYAKTNDGRVYPLDNNLDMLEEMLNPADFFRVNRQYIITLRAIHEMKTYSKARVIIKLKPEVKSPPVVSSERAADFKKWLAGELH